EACEVSRHSRQRLGADIESELVAEVKAQHGRARFTDCAVCSWVGRIWSGPRGWWKPRWIRLSLRISISVCESNRSDRAPKVVRVLGFEEGDRSVGKADIQQRKQACAMLETEMALQRGSLCDLVPEVLDVAVPELADLG